MNIAIIGTGGVGGYFGGRLAQAGNQVTFVVRGKHLQAIKEKGLNVKSIKGSFRVYPAQATSSIAALKNPDLVIIAVKAWQVKEVASQLKPNIHKNTMILPLQNGVLAAQEIAQIVGEKHVLNGLCKIISKIEAPGTIIHKSVEPTIVFGELDQQQTARAKQLENILNGAGISNILAKDIEAELWKKFLSICISGLLAVSRAPYGAVLEIPETRKMAEGLFTEVYHVGRASGVDLNEGLVKKTIKVLESLPYHSTSSLMRDVMEGKPSEIEYQNGTVVKLGEKLNIPTPINKFIYACILPMEKRARKNLP